MSRIYSNNPLSSLPVKNINFENVWNPSCYQKGEGVLLEGSIKSRSRFVITDSDKNKYRYFMFTFQIYRAHKRLFNDSNVEVEADLTTSEKIRTGYLHSSYKVIVKEQLDPAEVISLTQPHEILDKFNSTKPEYGCLFILVDEKLVEHNDISVNDELRLKTKGFGPFVETFSKINAGTSSKSHYAGDESLGDNWTSKILAVKESTTESQPGKGVNDCVADDEWND